MLRKLGVLVTSLALVLLSSLALVVVSAPQASADHHFLKLDLTSSGAGGDGDPKGPYKKYYPTTPAPFSIVWPRTSYLDWIKFSGCPKKPDGREYTSYRRMYRLASPVEVKDPDFKADYISGGNKYLDIGIVCSYPARDAVTDVNCAFDVTLTTTGPMSAPKVYGPTRTPSKWSLTFKNRQSPSLCVSSVNAKTDHQMTAFGRYKVEGKTGLMPCQRVDYGGGQPSVIANCGEANYVNYLAKAQRWCGGSEAGWNVPRLFTVDECRGPTWWACKVSSVSPIEVMDDGIARKPKWTQFGLTGKVKAPTNFRTLMTVAKESTPSKGEDVPQDHVTQQYQAPAATWMQGLIYQTPLRWWAPGSPGKPWMMDRLVKFDAQFEVVTSKITSVNVKTGQPTISKGTAWEKRTGTCPSTPLVVTVMRARNTR